MVAIPDVAIIVGQAEEMNGAEDEHQLCHTNPTLMHVQQSRCFRLMLGSKAALV